MIDYIKIAQQELEIFFQIVYNSLAKKKVGKVTAKNRSSKKYIL